MSNLLSIIISLLDVLFTKKTAAILVAIVSAAGAAYKLAPIPAQHHWHGIESLVLTADTRVAESQPLWEDEVARRFPDAVIVFSHGGSIVGEWVMQTPQGPAKVVDVATSLTAQYPGREIVFITCNPGHHVINIPHVHTALANVWIIPDRYVQGILIVPRIAMEPDAVGNIFEFN